MEIKYVGRHDRIFAYICRLLRHMSTIFRRQYVTWLLKTFVNVSQKVFSEYRCFICRHTPEARATRHPFSFIPFGMGPRNCIGMRMAQLEIKMALASVLQNYSPVLCEKSVVSVQISSHLHVYTFSVLYMLTLM